MLASHVTSFLYLFSILLYEEKIAGELIEAIFYELNAS